VAELIDPMTGTWDSQLIRDFFWEEDAANVLSIPGRVDREDFIAWHYDKGLFSVKSAYHVLEDEEQMKKQKQQGESNIGSRTSDANAVFWKKLWRLQCPPKVRQFLWRLAQNSLALKMNIKRRGIDLETRPNLYTV